MRLAAVLTALLAGGFALGLGGTKTASADKTISPHRIAKAFSQQAPRWVDKPVRKKHKSKRSKVNKYERYIAGWERRDHDTKSALRAAAFIFKVDYSWLSACNDNEGGHNDPERLAYSLRTGNQPGWNTAGSNAFGAMQFMLDRKPAPNPGDWGTYEKYADIAFDIAKDRGYWIPARYNTPASNVGQATTAAFMFAAGQSGQWSGAGC